MILIYVEEDLSAHTAITVTESENALKTINPETKYSTGIDILFPNQHTFVTEKLMILHLA